MTFRAGTGGTAAEMRAAGVGRVANTGRRPLLVGEDNPYGADPYYALYPRPVRSAGGRLCHLVLGYEWAQQYLNAWDRVNLCPERWNMADARAAAAEIRRDPSGRIVVCLGRKVGDAMELGYAPFTRRGRFVCLPHPSGRNRLWSEPGAFERAREVLREVGAPLGEEVDRG